MTDSEIIIVGAKGQLGLALGQKYPGAQKVDIDELDITSQAAVENYDWSGLKTILNAAAYTNVDGAETNDGRRVAWQVNAVAVANLNRIAINNGMTFVHISTDYVFDGTKSPHTETEAFAPLSVYGTSKAAGDVVVSLNPKHYILRTSWVIGEGKNFVRTMLELGQKGVNPSVVGDQIGRLTFTSELVRAIDYLLNKPAEFGTYNLSNDGKPVSWADITRAIFEDAGLDNTVTDVTTEQYYKGKDGIAPRPLQSSLDLGKIKASGFAVRDWREDLKAYVKQELSK
ncbi:MAG TPA: NAD(P)-dependent oxidoreductase [Candidatus Saccharimonadales bacterium]|nr:NAD(P)-dependent oxidoreductase [Candidatus Saccharimonadales bacterium]